MSDTAHQLFDLGKTFYQGGTITGVAANSYSTGLGVTLGQHRVFKYRDPSDRIKTTGDELHAILVQNRSGITLLPSQLVRWSATGYGKYIGGYTNVTASQPAGVVDPYLPATGVPDGDAFWVIVRGPCLVYRDKAALPADLAVGDILYTVTAAASTHSTTAGRFTKWGGTFTAAQTTDGTAGNILANQIGRAMSTAVTDTNTTAKVLVDLRIR